MPGSSRCRDVGEARKKLGVNYCEQPIYGRAGTSVICDSAILHTRARGSGDNTHRRRTMHQYYARGGWCGSRQPAPPLTDWNLIPERLALHEDPDKRRFFSQWNKRQCEWAADGFSLNMRARLPRAVGIPTQAKVEREVPQASSSRKRARSTSDIGTGYVGNDGFHGDPERGHEFWVYPSGKKLVTDQWDTYSADTFCSNHKFMRRHGDVCQHQCLGH